MRGQSFHERDNFDHITLIAEKAHHEANVNSDEAFTAAMLKAMARGKEKVRRGTFVDNSPPSRATRFYGATRMSVCGSPGAMCAEAIATGQSLR